MKRIYTSLLFGFVSVLAACAGKVVELGGEQQAALSTPDGASPKAEGSETGVALATLSCQCGLALGADAVYVAELGASRRIVAVAKADGTRSDRASLPGEASGYPTTNGDDQLSLARDESTIYWSTRTRRSDTDHYDLWKATARSAGAAAHVADLDGAFGTGLMLLGGDAHDAYVARTSDDANAIVRVDPAGLLVIEPGLVLGGTVDDRSVFWVGSVADNHYVLRTRSLEGGDVRTLGAFEGSVITAVASDPMNVYVATIDARPTPATGAVFAIAKAGGTPPTVVARKTTWSLSVFGGALYYRTCDKPDGSPASDRSCATSGVIERSPASGGASSFVAATNGSWGSLAVDVSGVYWIDGLGFTTPAATLRVIRN